MITPILEKWLLTGQAKNKIHHIGFGMFSQIQIPDDSYIVIHKIYWNGFLNQKLENVYGMSWKQFFAYTEYALKIQSDKESPMYYQMRNEVNFQYFWNGDPTSVLKLLNAPINDAQYDDYILMTPKKPIIFDTFITAFDYLNFTISRNSLLPSAANFAPPNNKANEKLNPNGIQDGNILLNATLLGTNGTTTTINPPSTLVTNPPIAALPADNTQNYHQLLDKQGGGDNGSYIDNPIGGLKLKYSEYVTNPLISIEYCIIQRNTAAQLSTL